MLPNDDHVARICPPSTLTDQGQVTAGSFSPRPARGSEPAEDSLSVHWLEHRHPDGTLSEKIGTLRTFLLASPVLNEFAPKKTGRLAAIPVALLQGQRVPDLNVGFDCMHTPRMPDVGDPHSDLHTLDPPMLQWPDDEAFRLAVQQFICDQVVLAEPGKV